LDRFERCRVDERLVCALAADVAGECLTEVDAISKDVLDCAVRPSVAATLGARTEFGQPVRELGWPSAGGSLGEQFGDERAGAT
jgi:hypothetical protein